MSALLRDLRTALRSLRRARGLTAAAVAVLALGIGANTAIFAVVDALLVKPLPFRDPGSLALVFEHLAPRRPVRLLVSAPAYVDLRGETAAFEGVEAVARTAGSLDRGDHADGVTVAHATPGLLPLLGVAQPPLGRGFVEGDGAVALLSEPCWRARFAADPAIAGRQIQLDGVTRTIVGVLPRAITPFFPGDLWTPLSLTADQLQPDRREYGLVLVLARLRSDPAQAQRSLDALSTRLREAHPLSGRSGFEVAPLREVFLGELRPGLLALMGAVGFVLLIACANVANLLLVRAATRQRELAVRAALGAGRLQLGRQLVVEGIALALAGGALGVLIALWAIELLAPLGSDAIRSSAIEIDARALAFTLAVSLAAGAAAGLVPALQATRPDLAAQLKGVPRFPSGRGRRVRDALVVAEVALSLVLLLAAAHELRAYRTLLRTDPGFEARGAISMAVSLPPDATPAAQQAFFSGLVARARTLPGVEAAGFAIHLPLDGGQGSWHFDVEGPGGHGSGHVVDHLQIHSPGTLAALRVPLLQGRAFSAREQEPVALVNQAFARRYFSGESALGKRVRPYRFHFEDAAGRRYWPLDEPRWFTIVGIVADVRQSRLSLEPRPEVVLPLQQFPVPEGALVVRGGTGADLERLLARLAPEVASQGVRPLEQVVRDSAAQQRDPMILLVLLSLLALLMAVMGIYGVMSFVVAERGRELSIRLALGAESTEMWRLLLGQGLSLASGGVVVGLAASAVLARFHLAPALEPEVCVALSAALLLAALLASAIPARKAARIDPRTAFRLE